MITLMIQGTTSDAGKTTVVAALCRWLARQGVSVAPFKPQNMALNSAVTVDGGEIGRSTALHALACGLAPHSDMNPVLLKPESDHRSQLIVAGKREGASDEAYLHRGIAARGFVRTFILADGMKVEGATLAHGLLHIDLARPEPERLVQRILIKTAG